MGSVVIAIVVFVLVILSSMGKKKRSDDTPTETIDVMSTYNNADDGYVSSVKSSPLNKEYKKEKKQSFESEDKQQTKKECKSFDLKKAVIYSTILNRPYDC